MSNYCRIFYFVGLLHSCLMWCIWCMVLFLYAWIISVYCHCFKYYFTTEQSIVKLTRPALWGEHTASSEGRQEEEIDPAGLTFLWHITFSGLMWFVLGFIYTHCSYLFLFLLSLFLCKDHCILIACCPSWSVGDETPDIRKHSDANGVYLLEVSFLSFLCEDAEYNYQDTCENLKSMIFLVAYYDWHAQAWYFIWFCQDRRGELMHASISWQLGSSRSQYSICDATCGN